MAHRLAFVASQWTVDTTYKCACMDATILVNYFCKLLSILQLKLAFFTGNLNNELEW